MYTCKDNLTPLLYSGGKKKKNKKTNKKKKLWSSGIYILSGGKTSNLQKLKEL